MLPRGGLSALGLGLADLFQLTDVQAAKPRAPEARHFGKAKSCILLYLYGAPSQLETLRFEDPTRAH